MSWIDDVRRDIVMGHEHRHHEHRCNLEARIAELEEQIEAERRENRIASTHVTAELAEITSLLNRLVVGIPATRIVLSQD